jgi:hypothetical protein
MYMVDCVQFTLYDMFKQGGAMFLKCYVCTHTQTKSICGGNQTKVRKRAIPMK